MAREFKRVTRTAEVQIEVIEYTCDTCGTKAQTGNAAMGYCEVFPEIEGWIAITPIARIHDPDDRSHRVYCGNNCLQIAAGRSLLAS